MRITSRTTVQRALTNLANSQERLATLQEQLATGRRISRPSDDPAGITRDLALRTSLNTGTQHVRNIDSGLARLSSTEAALASLTDVLQRARELAVSGANSTLQQSQRDQIALEVSGLLEEAIAIGNTNVNGQYLFAGHKSTTVPFAPVGVPIASVTYNGDAGLIEREVSVSVRAAVNVPGDQAFNTTFTSLITLRDDLQAGNLSALQNADLDAIDTALDGVLRVRGQLGATTNRLEVTRSRLEESEIANEQELAEIEATDLVETLVDLNAQETVHEAALSAAARSIQTSLLDFLR